MWGGYDHGWGWGMGFGMTGVALFWVLVIAAIAILVKCIAAGSASGARTPPKSMIDILKERHARGAITHDELARKKRE